MSDDAKVEKSNTQGSLNRLTRRIDEIRRDVDILLNKNKVIEQMLEEVLASLAMFKQLQLSTRDHHDNLTQEIKAEVVESKMEVKDKANEILDKIDKKKIIKVVNKNILNKLLFWK